MPSPQDEPPVPEDDDARGALVSRRARENEAAAARRGARHRRLLSAIALVLPLALGAFAVKRAKTTVDEGIARAVLLQRYAEVRAAAQAVERARTAQSDAGAAVAALELARATYRQLLTDDVAQRVCGGADAPCRL